MHVCKLLLRLLKGLDWYPAAITSLVSPSNSVLAVFHAPFACFYIGHHAFLTWRLQDHTVLVGSWHKGPGAPAGHWEWAGRAVALGCLPASCNRPWRRSCDGGVDPLLLSPNVCVRCASPWPPAPASEYWLPVPRRCAGPALWAQGTKQQTKETSGK